MLQVGRPERYCRLHVARADATAWRYWELGIDFDKWVLSSIGNKVLKSIMAQYSAKELLSKRTEMLSWIKAI